MQRNPNSASTTAAEVVEAVTVEVVTVVVAMEAVTGAVVDILTSAAAPGVVDDGAVAGVGGAIRGGLGVGLARIRSQRALLATQFR
jgi:hypothetical protein